MKTTPWKSSANPAQDAAWGSASTPAMPEIGLMGIVNFVNAEGRGQEIMLPAALYLVYLSIKRGDTCGILDQESNVLVEYDGTRLEGSEEIVNYVAVTADLFDTEYRRGYSEALNWAEEKLNLSERVRAMEENQSSAGQNESTQGQTAPPRRRR